MASPPPLPTSDRLPGLSFTPEDAELISRYLGPKIAGQPLPADTAEFIHEADVYAADPATLCAKFAPASSGIEESRYFFTYPRAKSSRGSRKSRTVGEGKGTWHAESRKDVVDEKDRLLGYRRSFCHEISSGEKSGWLMMEFAYGANQEDGQGVPVVCKIYKNPRTARCSTRKKRKAKDEERSDPAAPRTAGCSTRKKRKAKDEERSDPAAAPSAGVRRRLQFRSPPASNPPSPTSEFLEDDFLNESLRQHSEAEEPRPAFDPISFLADGHALPALNCYDTTVRSGGWPIAEESGSWTTAAPLRSGIESQGYTSAPDYSFLHDDARFVQSFPGTTSMPLVADWSSPAASEHYSESCFGSCTSGMEFFASLAVAGTTHMPPVAGWSSPAASGQYGQSCFGSCTSGMEFLGSLPVTGFEHNASIYWSAEPSFAPTASSAASTPLRSSGAEWASPMLLPLQG